MKLILIRHGETLQNSKGCYIGHHDAKLSQKGKQQAVDIVHQLKKYTNHISAIYSSDLSRCVDTARPLARECSLPINTIRDLRELHFGKWERSRYQDLITKEQQQLTAWYNDPFRVAPPDGETLHELGKRVDQSITTIISKTKEQDTVAIFTHGGPLRWILSKWIDQDSRLFWQVEETKRGEGFILVKNGSQWVRQPISAFKH